MWYAKILISTTNILFTIVEIFLGLRFILKLFAANPLTPFVDWIYTTSEPLLYPFRGMFPSPLLEQGVILEFSTLFALIAYALLAWLIVELINYLASLKKDDEDKK